MRFNRKVLIEKGHLDIAPLIDVIFLLLIFFMLTSSFVFQPGIRVNLPKAVTSEVLNSKLLTIVITEDNSTYIEDRKMIAEEITSRIYSASAEQRPILIKADKGSDLGKVIEIWDICRKAEVKQINIATTQ